MLPSWNGVFFPVRHEHLAPSIGKPVFPSPYEGNVLFVANSFKFEKRFHKLVPGT